MYLLLCLLTCRSKSLAQIDVSTFINDQYLFKSIADEYQQIKRAETWYHKIPKINWLRIPRWCSLVVGDLHLFVPKTINFVKVSVAGYFADSALPSITNCYRSSVLFPMERHSNLGVSHFNLFLPLRKFG
jgi:hypothetical protein